MLKYLHVSTMRTREDLEKIAKKQGWILNPNDRVVEGNLRVQNKNFEKYGHYYCPCKADKVDGNICRPCVDSPEEIKEMGHCTCNLYFDPNWEKKEK